MNRVRIAIMTSVPLVLALLLLTLAGAIAPVASAQPLYPSLDLSTFAPKVGPGHTGDLTGSGFGDRQNGWAWSMAWFKNKLYVGTNRAFHCMEIAGIAAADPTGLAVYPPRDPDISCTPDPGDLPSAAQIWTYDPSTQLWSKIFESPMDVPVPNKPGKFVARDIGFRNLHVHRFTDRTGTAREVLMASGVNSGFYLGPTVGPARLLWSEDGTTFNEVSRTAPIFALFQNASFRGAATFNNKFYVIAGTVTGKGVVLEADDPRGGATYRLYTPPGLYIYELKAFNGYLWLGTSNAAGFELYKTNKTVGFGPPLAMTDLTKVMEFGGNHPLNQGNSDVISLHEFNGRLYVGGNAMNNFKGAELFRVTPGATAADPDEWELISGKPRTNLTPAKLPLSGFDVGMGWPFNEHMWRMETFDGRLYLGTFDLVTQAKDIIGLGPLLEPAMGFDLFSTEDGIAWNVIDRGGFVRNEPCLAVIGPECQGLNFGVRNMLATPQGLWLGTANYYYGLQLWLGQPTGWPGTVNTTLMNRPAPPKDLTVETKSGARLLSWEPVPNAILYQIWRADSTQVDMSRVAQQPMVADVYKDLKVVGTSTKPMYVDKASDTLKSHYAVVAIRNDGRISGKSNMVPVPFLGDQPTFTKVSQFITQLKTRHRVPNDQALAALTNALNAAKVQAMKGNVQPLLALTAQVKAKKVQNTEVLDRYGAEDLGRMLAILARRVEFAAAGQIAAASLN
jgi:hypothetical protein